MKKIIFILNVLLIASISDAQTGIGTTTPAVKLHVKSNGPILRLEGSDHAYMEFYPQGSSTRFGYMVPQFKFYTAHFYESIFNGIDSFWNKWGK